MKNGWPMFPLGEVLRHRKEFIAIDDTQTYKRCRVQLHAQGVVLRDSVPGIEIKTKKQQVCRAGEFLVAEIDAKHGGYGLVPNDLDGAIVSSHYFLFEPIESKLDRGFLNFFCRTPAFAEQVAAQGSTNYAAIRPSHVMAYQMPLPPLSEQRRIVARIESLAAKIAEARSDHRDIGEALSALPASAMHKHFGDEPQSDWIPLQHFVNDIHNGWSPQCEARRAAPEEWGVLKVGAVSFGEFDERENKALPPALEPHHEYEIKAGDFLMSRANTVQLVGACALVRTTRSRLMLCDKIFRFNFKEPETVNREYWVHLMKSPPVRRQIERGASGTSPTMKNISKPKILGLLLPRHSAAEQRRIVAHLDALTAKTAALKQLQSQSAAELEALLPSILDRAFKGEL